MKNLEPFRMPLQGVTLIEASAGTGKTYSITSLYLRLLLEQGLSVEEILVVTFTVAATEELRERIRKRIVQALDYLEAEDRSKCLEEDEALAGWLYRRNRAEEDAARLRAMLASMDSAAVFTIHGFCQRMLAEHAFESGLAFDQEFIESEDLLRLQAAQDFWRKWFGDETLHPLLAQWLYDRHGDPEQLLKTIAVRLGEPLSLLPETPPVEEIASGLVSTLETLEKAQGELKESWAEQHQAVVEILRHDPALNRRSYGAGAVEKAIAAAEQLCASSTPLLEPLEKQELLCADTLAQKTKKGKVTPTNPFFEAAGAYTATQASLRAGLERLSVAFQKAARAFVQTHIEEHKRAAHQLYFNDLLLRMEESLQGEPGRGFARHLRRRYPVALIDEFQDTDAVQYSIFRAIYGAQESDTGLCLIGDPKQAIYGFRGGDIFTYLAAARDASRRYSLATNWRSGSRLVEAVNRLFGNREDAFLQPGIEYHAVEPSPRADDEPLLLEGAEPVPLQFWRLHAHEGNASLRKDGTFGSIRVGDARIEVAAQVAGHIATLLQPGRATLGGEPLQARDIAILVRRHKDTPYIREALRQRGINSVTLTEESVFSTEEAASLQHLLQAVIDCEDEGLLRYALADRLLGRTAREIDALLQDDNAWEPVQQRFFGYRELWRERGFIQAFQKLFREEGIAQRLLVDENGERRLANLLQLMELLQQAARIRPGMEELVRWLADERELAGKYEEAKLRLESDEGLVKIVTLHASKGLEYPVVYIPFPFADDVGRKEKPWFYHDAQGQPCLYLGGDEVLEAEAEQRAGEESLAERLRLLYVAVTRAARLCVLSWGKVNGAGKSALAWLLYPGDPGASGMKDLDEQALFEPLERLSDQAPEAIEVRDPPPATSPEPLAAGERERGSPPRVRHFSAVIERNWRVSSYSALVRGGGSDQPDFDAAPAERESQALPGDPIQALPAGSDFGLLTHKLLEELDFSRVEDEALREQIRRLSRRYGLPGLQEQGLGPMVEMIGNLLDTILPQAGISLRQLGSEERLDEMEFHFSVAAVAAPQMLQRILQSFPHWKQAADHLNFAAFRGLMHGYIDLVFRHGGRYYLADYKSNRLDDYGPEGVEEAMVAHHYPLQALIYSLALHRHLRQKLADYDPGHHFGGVFYLFTRGMRSGTGRGIWFRRPEPELLEALDQAFGRGVPA